MLYLVILLLIIVNASIVIESSKEYNRRKRLHKVIGSRKLLYHNKSFITFNWKVK
jgi:hypothetical protein